MWLDGELRKLPGVSQDVMLEREEAEKAATRAASAA